MKLNVNTNELVLSNVSTTGEFKIRNSAKAFNILSSGLYSNKIKAIIRELSCNAVDSHVAAGKADIPFEVHLPSMLEPWFSVKDFGLGLDHDGVVNIYTTYFESTKTESNDFIGALGLGSKSPFSYTDNFSVTAIKDGKQRIYSAFINEQGIPSIALMEEHDTTEANGVEVKLSVTNRNDYHSFRNEAMFVFSWFKLKPKVFGDYHPLVEKYREKDIVPGVHIRDNNYSHSRGAFAVMGNIAYPLSNFPNANQHLGTMEYFIRESLELHFEIGELDFAASREELSYIPQTIANIKKKFEELTAELEKHIIKKVGHITCQWTKAEELNKLRTEHIFNAAVLKYVTDTKFPLVDTTNYNFLKRFMWKVTDLKKDKNLEIRSFTTSSHGNYTQKYERVYDRTTSSYIDHTYVQVSKDAIFILNDLKIGSTTRARYHYAQPKNFIRGTVYVLDSSEPDLVKRQAIYDEFLKELQNPPVVIKASALDKKEKVPNANTGSVGVMELHDNSKTSRYLETTWRPYRNATLDPKKTYYYVTLSNYKTIKTDAKGKDTEYDILPMVHNIRKSELKNISDIEIFGVRKNRIDEIKKLKNWIPLEDYLMAQVAKVDDKEIAALVATDLIDNSIATVYNSSLVVSQLPVTSDYAVFSRKYATKKSRNAHHGDAIAAIVNLCKSFGRTVEVDKLKKNFNDELAKVQKKYPLIAYLNRYDLLNNASLGKEAADYIRLVDKAGNP